MVARGPGAVGCAHCKQLGADTACTVCKRLVCEGCAADWSTCDEPWGRTFRLGLTGRLIDVDPGGRFGLVSRWLGPLRLLELRGLRWIKDASLPSRQLGAPVRPRLTRDGRLIVAVYDFTSLDRDDVRPFRGLAMSPVATNGAPLLLDAVLAPARGEEVSAHGDVYSYVTDTEVVTLISPGASAELPAGAGLVSVAPMARGHGMRVAVYDPLPRKVIQWASVDPSRDLLAAATWGEIVLHRMVGDRLARVGAVKTTGDVRWVAIAGPYVAAAVPGAIHVWRLTDTLAIGELVLAVADRPGAAALSPDGRYLAVATERSQILVHALDAGTVEAFDGHTDDVRLVRFVGDEQLLVTADDDNRVIIRPRTATGYARALKQVTLHDG